MIENTLESDNLNADGDRFYNALLGAHEGLTEEQSHALNARLILLMANAIGDVSAIETLIHTAGSYTDD